MSEGLLDLYAERIKAWRRASAAMSYSAIDPKRNAVELYDELGAIKTENNAARAIMQKFVDKVDRGMARSIETYTEMKQWMEEE